MRYEGGADAKSPHLLARICGRQHGGVPCEGGAGGRRCARNLDTVGRANEWIFDW